MKNTLAHALGVAAIVAAGATAAHAFELDGEPSPAMIIFGPVNDGGWSQAFNETRQNMEETLGTPHPLRGKRA